MKIRWIVMDMDGTLLNSQDEITDRTRRALIECERLGIRLILASGRSYVRMQPFARELMMEEYNGAFIEVNGLVLNCLTEGKRTVFAQLEKKDMEELVPFLREQEIEIQFYQDETLRYWIPECRREIKLRERSEKGYPDTHPLAADLWSWVTSNKNNYPNLVEIHSMEELPEHLNKMNCTDTPDKMEHVFRLLKQRFSDRYEIVRTAPRIVEIQPQGISKGKTLRKYMGQEKILPEEVMAFGDGENDVDMFRQVSYGIAMGNAKDYVKKYAFDVTSDHDRDGIAEALVKYGVIDSSFLSEGQEGRYFHG